MTTTELQITSDIDRAIAEWLTRKTGRTGSQKTRKAYQDTMISFRLTLSEGRIDLFGEPSIIARVAAIWASRRVVDGDSSDVAASTYNQRLAIISSFYTFVAKSYGWQGINPIRSLEARPVQPYAKATPLDTDTVNAGFERIDRDTLAGLRDYAILAVALATGRRATELAHLTGKDLTVSKRDLVTLVFEAKGKKVKRDTLDADVSSVLLDYLHAIHGDDLQELAPDTRLWLSFSNATNGKPIGARALSDICKKHLGTSKVHALRHTFAIGMMKSGAAITELQARLGHSSVRTTQIYAAELVSDENPYAAKLTVRFGIKRRSN